MISELICSAARGKGARNGALGFLIWLAALIVAVLSWMEPALVLPVVIALVWLGLSRQRRGRHEHGGLRALR